MISILQSYVTDFDETPRSEKFAFDLASRIIEMSDHATLAKSILELSRIFTDFKYKEGINPLSHILHTADISSDLHALIFLMNQVARGEGSIDGEGLLIYTKCALDVGVSADRIMATIDVIDSATG